MQQVHVLQYRRHRTNGFPASAHIPRFVRTKHVATSQALRWEARGAHPPVTSSSHGCRLNVFEAPKAASQPTENY